MSVATKVLSSLISYIFHTWYINWINTRVGSAKFWHPEYDKKLQNLQKIFSADHLIYIPHFPSLKLTPWRKYPKVHHRTHNSPPPVPVLRQSNPIHTPQPNHPKIHSDPIFPPTPWSSQRSLSFGLSHQNPVQNLTKGF
jgi:hypothetical protein